MLTLECMMSDAFSVGMDDDTAESCSCSGNCNASGIVSNVGGRSQRGAEKALEAVFRGCDFRWIVCIVLFPLCGRLNGDGEVQTSVCDTSSNGRSDIFTTL
jgi:hypothetical protein